MSEIWLLKISIVLSKSMHLLKHNWKGSINRGNAKYSHMRNFKLWLFNIFQKFYEKPIWALKVEPFSLKLSKRRNILDFDTSVYIFWSNNNKNFQRHIWNFHILAIPPCNSPGHLSTITTVFTLPRVDWSVITVWTYMYISTSKRNMSWANSKGKKRSP